jgi:magnesium chelatase family protein
VSGGGGLTGTLADYTRFCEMLRGGGQLDGHRIIGPRTLELMRRNHLPGGKDLASLEVSEPSETIRERISECRKVQRLRFGKETGTHCNSAMSPRLIKKHCELDAEGSAYLERAMNEMNFSARAHDRILKVARTMADLDTRNAINGDDILNAINFRTLDRNMWV